MVLLVVAAAVEGASFAALDSVLAELAAHSPSDIRCPGQWVVGARLLRTMEAVGTAGPYVPACCCCTSVMVLYFSYGVVLQLWCLS